MRAYRHNKRRYFSNFLKRIFNKYTLKYWIILGVLGAGAIVFSIMTGSKPITVNQTGFYKKDVLKIGVGLDNPSFAGKDQAGEIQGFERDLAEAVFGALYPDARLDFIEIEEQEASYFLRNKEIDAALCMLTPDVLKSQGLALSSAYFQDGVYAFVTSESGITGANQFEGKTVGIMAADVKSSLVTQYLEAHGVNADIIEYASYPDAIDALKAGRICAVVTTRYKMSQYGEGVLMIDQPMATLGYRIAFWTDNTNTRTFVNQKLAELRESGGLERLMAKYGLIETRIEDE